MESMDYTSYFTPAPQAFGYLGFVNDANVPNGVSGESNAPIQVRISESSKAVRVIMIRPKPLIPEFPEHGIRTELRSEPEQFRIHAGCFRVQFRRANEIEWQQHRSKEQHLACHHET
jgi:hypothetical protein